MPRGTLPGTIKLVFLTSAPASLSAPAAAEITAGIDLIGPENGEGVAEINGWTVSASTIPTPDYRSHVVGNVPGDSQVQSSSLGFYYEPTTQPIYTALTEGVTGYVVFMRDGDATGEESEVWPVTVQTRFRRPARDQAHIFDVNFSTGVPTVGTLAV